MSVPPDLFTDIYNKFAHQEQDYCIIDDTFEHPTSPHPTTTKSPQQYADEIYFQFSENCIIFDINTYLRNILQSYKYNPQNILHQLDLDFKRTSIYINNNRITNIYLFERILRPYSKYELFNIKLNIIFIALCLQSSFAFPYEYLTSRYPTVLISSNYTIIRLQIGDITNDRSIDFKLSVCFKYNHSHLLHLTVNIYFDHDNMSFDKYGIIDWNIQ